MRPIQAALLLVLLTVLGGLVWWVSASGRAEPRVAGPAPFADVRAEPELSTPLALAPGELEAGAAPRERAVERQPEAASAVAGEAAAGATGPLTGRVLDPFGQPLAGARVYAAPGSRSAGLAIDLLDPAHAPWARRVEAQSGADGRFRLPPVSASDLRLAVRAAGHAPLRVPVQLVPGRGGELGDFALEASVVLAGRVEDRAGRAVAGAELRALPIGNTAAVPGLGLASSTPLAVSGPTGAFRIDELAAGPYRLRVTHADHPPQSVDGSTEAPGERRAGLVVTLADGHPIAGRVVGFREEERGALRVTARPAVGGLPGGWNRMPPERSVPIAAGGAFVLRGLSGDVDYALQVVGETDGGPFPVPRSAVAVARAGESDVELAVVRPLAIEGRVVDASNGEPVERFSVEAGSLWPSPLGSGEPDAHADGRFRYELTDPVRAAGAIGGGSPGLTVRVRAPGYAPLELRELEVPADRPLDLGELSLRGVPELLVRVLSAEDERPIEGARVTLEVLEASSMRGGGFPGPWPGAMGGEEGTSDPEGLARLPSRPGERGVLRATHPGFAPFESDPLELPAVEGTERTLRLSRGGTVEVSVVDSRGEPAPGVRVLSRRPDRGDPLRAAVTLPERRETDAEGRARFERLEPGAHSFRASMDEGRALAREALRSLRGNVAENALAWTEVVVREGETAELLLRLEPRGSLAGAVTEGGRALPGASVTLLASGETSRFSAPAAETDGRGRYRLERLALGSYELVVAHPARAMPHRVPVRVAEGENALDVELPTASIAGRVTSGGQPLAGAWVVAELDGARASGPDDALPFGTNAASEAPRGSVSTDAEGRYVLRGVVPGVSLRVRAGEADHRGARSEALVVGPEEARAGVDLELARGGALEVRVLRSDGSAVTGAMVVAVFRGEQPGEGAMRRALVPEGGLLRLRGLAPGPWTLTAAAFDLRPGAEEPAGPPQPVEVEVREGESRAVELRLP